MARARTPLLLLLLAAVTGTLFWSALRAKPAARRNTALSQPLMTAVRRGDAPAVKELLQRGASPDARASDPRPIPLQEQILNLLSGRKPVRVSNIDTTALTEAVQFRHKDVALLLLEAGADTEARNMTKGRLTALMLAAALPYQEDVVRALLARGAHVNARDEQNRTPLMYASRPQSARLLLQKGADVNARTKSGLTVLQAAVSRGNTEMVQLLLAAGADPNVPDRFGRTPLLSAQRRGNIEMVRALKKAGAR